VSANLFTRIVASLGPSLSNEADLAAALELDADFRQPFGYRIQDHFSQFAALDRLRGKLGKPSRIYVDLPSERPRIGVLKRELQLQPGQRVRVVCRAEGGDADELPMPGWERFAPALLAGHRLLIRDGHTILRLTEVAATHAQAVVEQSVEGVATNNNIMFPDSAVMFEPVVEEDRRLLRRYRDAGMLPDWIMLSLVTSVQQVMRAKAALHEIWGTQLPRVMVKIETAKAVEQMTALLAEAEGLLVGRGDLGMAVPPETIPAIQEDVVRQCRAAGKTVLVATEFLQRFAETGVPNRAELSDVALAARQGVSGIVLTKETSGSPFALASIRLAQRVIAVETARLHRT
jgi:pyruvate kinase